MSARIIDNSSNYTLGDLPAQFENPLDGIDGVHIPNNFDASGELLSLKMKLQPKSDWSSKSDAIQRIMSLIKGGVFSFPDFEFNELAPDIAACITDLRSTLVKWGSMCASAAAQVLGSRFANYVDIFIPSFFKQTTHGTAIISQSCRLAILQIAASVPHKRTVRSILTESTSKSTIHRKIVAESIQKMQQNWPSAVYQSSIVQVKNVLKEMVSDKSPDVRKIAKEASEFQPSPRSPTSPRRVTQSFSIKDKNKSSQGVPTSPMKSTSYRKVNKTSFSSTPASPTASSSNPNLQGSASSAAMPASASSTPIRLNSSGSKSSKESNLNSNSNSSVPKISSSISKDLSVGSNSNSSIPKINISLSKESSLSSNSNPSIAKINLSSSIDSNSNSNSNSSLTTVFTPTTVTSATFLAQQVENFVKNPSVKKDKLINSVIQAIILTPNEKSWISHVLFMINEIPNDLKSRIGEILFHLNFNGKLLKKSLNVFGFEDIFNSYKRSAFKLRLSAVTLARFPDFPMSDENIEMLKQLIRKKHKASESDAVIISDCILERKINQIIECIIEGKPYNQHVQSICATENFGPIQNSLEKINSILNENFFKDSENQEKKNPSKLQLAQIKERTLQYIESMSIFFPEVSLDSLVESIIIIIRDSPSSEESSYLPPIAEKCILKLLNNNSCNLKNSLIPLIDDYPNEVGIILQLYLEGLQKDELKKYLNFLPDIILPLFESESVTVRRTAVMSYVQFFLNFGENFKKQISKLSEVNQILVERFSDKRKLI